jgi:CubicO group peptidase (beta-lactamase class C family)
VKARLAVLTLALSVVLPAFSATLLPAADSALKQLLERGRQTHSAAVLILQDGHDIGHYYPHDRAPGPIELMSVTKSVVALGIGQLLDSGKIKSLDQPVADFYPEWRQGRKKDITVRMLLNHTSGLQDFPRTDVEVYPAPDAIQLALAAELTSKPGTEPFYSNKAVNLLGGIIEKASGLPMDVFFRDGLFKAMGIHPGEWDTDKAGHPYAMAGLHLTAADLAQLGQLVMDRGQWHGQRLLTASYVDSMLAPSSMEGQCGLLWWRFPRWTHFDTDPASFAMLRKHGVAEDTVAKLQHGLEGAHFNSVDTMYAGLRKALGSKEPAILKEQLIGRGIGPYRLFKFTAPVVAYDGNGDGGQYVVIVPKAGLVAVRQINAEDDQENAGEGYKDFVDRVIALAEASGRLGAP